MPDVESETVHKTTNRAIEVLDFVRRSNGATVADILDHFDMSRSTAYTHLNTLNQQGLIVRENGQYWVGLRFREFSVNAIMRKPSFQIVERKLYELAEETDTESEFLVEEGGRVTHVYHSESLSHDRIRLYLHNTAAGKAILAKLPDERVNEIIDQWGLPQQTPYTITDEQELLEELDKISERGYSYNDKECFEGYHGIGCAVEALDGSVLGGLTIGGPVYRVPEDTLKNEYVDVLLDAVADIERSIESQRETITAELASR